MATFSTLHPRTIIAASSGNVLEWYDFTVYSFLATIIGKVFFPASDPVASTLSAYAVLAVGYLARPLGGVIFGYVGDRVGRKPALLASVIVMGACAAAIAFLPDYATIGVAAPVLLVLLRIVQGIAVAGEYTASGIILVESTAPPMRHRTGAIVAFAMMIGCVIGSGVPAALSAILTEAQMESWGWRLPFLLGSLVALTSLTLRLGLSETATPDDEPDQVSPIIRAVREHWRSMVDMMLLIIPTAVLYFIIFVYASSYLVQSMHVSSATALDFSTLNILLAALLIPPIGWLADKLGARTVLLTSTILTILAAVPLWAMMHQSNLLLVFLGQSGLGMLNAVGWALSLSALVAMVPNAVRCSAVSIGYNVTVAIFGGTTPFVATYLVTRTGDDFAPVWYLIAASLMSLIAIARLPGRERTPPPQAAASP